MAGEWQQMAAAQAFIINPRIKPPHARSLPFVDMAAVDGSAQYVEASQTRGLGGGSRFEDGDTLMARITPCLENGKIARFRSTDRHGFGFGSTEFIVFRGRDGVTTSDFAFYTVKSQVFRDFAISQMSGTSGRQRVPTTCFEHLHLSIPPIKVQEDITAVLSSLDEKIEINRKAAATLEEMARALFKCWFVDFDPVHANAEGRDTGLPADIAALFPDCFDDEGLPKEWKQSTVGELFSIVAGNTPSTKQAEYWGGAHAWATPKDMSGLPGPLLTQTDRSLTEQGFNVCSSGKIPEMSLLMSSRAPIGYLAFNALPVSINQGIAAFVEKTLSPFYAWAWCHENMKLIKSNANGSTFQEISKGVLRTVAMIKPSPAVHDAFVAIMKTTFSRIVQLAEETASLTSLRDELLPKLLSGELGVADTESVIAAA
ncbi:hypothetical protein CA262_04475 [Sphingobium sp. GW456-12-10-14-TSB1]|uniref:restriction endonuclease subunit S n=1 Tax=unclassified Sphingobium TaxID=2611147 RepID=UPI000B6FCC6C|nr:restriction endonuclease subunit S [Sphingobium sp. GW456-12-10-14-TSB1]OUC54205.1 hypothetical protein CA262_04475 [Sphingobium sp. GW456-12-10-14-TSB1]